jgi:HlyD family secretion protein
LAQADAKLKAAEARYNAEAKQLKDLREQLEKCTIIAPRPGLLVYGDGSGEVRDWRGEEQIREGATVRENQTVITVPDMRTVCIKVRIHESYIKKIQKGQKVHIKVDAFPDRRLEGEVSQVGTLPDSENSWLNPDMKVYRTTIKIDGEHDWIRPGMTAKVEILVNHLDDVVYVPIQAVNPLADNRKVCYVADGGKPQQREVEVGEFNDEFIEIEKGIAEGERVCLRPPAGLQEKGESGMEKASDANQAAKTDNKVVPTGGQ